MPNYSDRISRERDHVGNLYKGGRRLARRARVISIFQGLISHGTGNASDKPNRRWEGWCVRYSDKSGNREERCSPAWPGPVAGSELNPRRRVWARPVRAFSFLVLVRNEFDEQEAPKLPALRSSCSMRRFTSARVRPCHLWIWRPLIGGPPIWSPQPPLRLD